MVALQGTLAAVVGAGQEPRRNKQRGGAGAAGVRIQKEIRGIRRTGYINNRSIFHSGRIIWWRGGRKGGSMMSGNGNLIDDVDEMLTDSRHPLDEQQARRMSLMLLRQVYNEQLVIRRELADWKVDVRKETAELERRLKDVEKLVPWVKGLAWFATAVGLALIGALVRMVFP